MAGNNDMLNNLKQVYWQALEKVGDTEKKTVIRKIPKKANKKNTKLKDVQEMLDQGMHEDEIVDFYMMKLKEKKAGG